MGTKEIIRLRERGGTSVREIHELRKKLKKEVKDSECFPENNAYCRGKLDLLNMLFPENNLLTAQLNLLGKAKELKPIFKQVTKICNDLSSAARK